MTIEHVHTPDPGRAGAAAVLARRMLHPDHYRTSHVPVRTCIGCGGGSRIEGSYDCRPHGAELSESCFACFDSGQSPDWKVWSYTIPWREIVAADGAEQLAMAL